MDEDHSLRDGIRQDGNELSQQLLEMNRDNRFFEGHIQTVVLKKR